MPNHVLDNFQPALRTQLAKHGWAVEREERWRSDLWVAAVWTLRSHTPPVDRPLYLIFAFDDYFYWVTIATAVPINYQENYWENHHLYLKRGWERELPGFLAMLDRLRWESDDPEPG